MPPDPQNLLSGALSPYLLQHAENPVHWREWNPESLAEARQRGCPVLLSIGYAACHWCHVMAHESFANPQIADLMNRLFVNIKVDREERPDLDRIYQTAHHLLARRPGGWPLTMFLSPDGVPFFGGTYFPPEPRGGLPAFPDILRRVADAWEKHPEALAEQNSRLTGILAQLDSPAHSANAPDLRPLQSAREKYRAAFDRENGGIGPAPKFPRPAELAFCMAEGFRADDSDLFSQTQLTLEKMSNGGIFDHLGGGFCRYAVDSTWTIPHFEKMLYDNALLLPLLADLHNFRKNKTTGGKTQLQESEEDPVLRAAKMTGEWALREMRDGGGGFWSSLDADSEGGEGRYYIWSDAEIQSLLSPPEFAVVAARFGLAAGPNFESAWHLALRQPLQTTADILKAPAAELWESARRKLLAAREKRVRPATDDKILAGWNGLMIKGLARAGRIFGMPEWEDAARTALDFVRREMRTEDGKLLGVWRRGKTGRIGFLDDYGFMLEGALEVLAGRFSPEVLEFARELGWRIVEDFSDSEGGFFLTPENWEGGALIRRPLPFEDDAIPSANGAAARGLLRLSWLSGDMEFSEAAEDCLRRFWESARTHPEVCPTYLLALREWLLPPPLVLLTGEEAECQKWRRVLESEFPLCLFFILPESESGRAALPESLQKPAPEEGARGYVCAGFSCQMSADSLGDLRGQLSLQLRTQLRV